MGWTRQSAAISLLRIMEDHRRAAGERVAKYRGERRMSQEDLAAASGLSVKTISRFEQGRHEGRRDTVRSLAQALGVSEMQILGNKPDPFGAPEDGQLDRIEAKLDVLLTHFGLTGTEEPSRSLPPGPPTTPRAAPPKRSARGRQAS